jgi:hypothetical protein
MLVKFTLAGDGSQPLRFLEQNEQERKQVCQVQLLRAKYEKGKIKKIQFAKRIFKISVNAARLSKILPK